MYLSETIRAQYGLRKEQSGCISTKNHAGAQMSEPSPVMNAWLEAYDGSHPLLDIGSAYGINTVEALRRGIPTFALDNVKIHLNVAQDVAKENGYDSNLTCILGSLPNNLPFKDDFFSGILVSEVFHFLTGDEIVSSLNAIHRKLRKGGILAFSLISVHFFSGFDDAFIARFFEELEKGVDWPGYRDFDKDVAEKIEAMVSKRGKQYYDHCGVPRFYHFCTLSQITKEVEKAGFHIISAIEGMHPGYPLGADKMPKSNIQVICTK